MRVAFATIFTAPGDEKGACGYGSSDDRDAAFEAGYWQLALYEELEKEGRLQIIRSRDDLASLRDRLGIVLLMEGADPIRHPDDAAWWHARGLRIVGLTWSRGTRYAGGNASHGSLTGEGVELVGAMDALGIVHDASHLCDASFDDLLSHSRGRLIASHSNCRSLAGDDQRHLRDDQVCAIADRDGIIGLNLYTRFLHPSQRATAGDCTAHVQRVVSLMGHVRGTALGSDMDGGFTPADLPEGIERPEDLGAISRILASAGWSEEDLDAFRFGNWHRLLEDILPGA